MQTNHSVMRIQNLRLGQEFLINLKKAVNLKKELIIKVKKIMKMYSQNTLKFKKHKTI